MGLSHYCRLSWLNDRQLWHWHKNISISVRRSGTARILDCGFACWPGLSVVRPKAEVFVVASKVILPFAVNDRCRKF